MESTVPDVAILNENLIQKLKGMRVIQTPPVEAAFRTVPRHLFVPGIPLEQVYQDQVIVTKELDGHPASSCEQPAIVAVMLEQLGLEPGQRVLEIGAGTGHTAALVAQIIGEQGHVVTLDIEPDLVASAREHLRSAGLERVQVMCADGWLGYPDAAPYDRILLTVASWDLAPAWQAQLKPGGRIVLPLDIKAKKQKAVALARVGDHLESLSVRECGFMPLRGELAPWPTEGGGPLGPEPGLYIGWEGKQHADLKTIYEWITSASRDLSTGVQVTTGEIWGGLSFWLALHATNNCGLTATGAMVDRHIVPPLFTIATPQHKSAGTHGLLGERGLAALAFQQEPVAHDDASRVEISSEIFVRAYGQDETPARQLVEQVRAWDAAGRPSGQGLQIRAYPRDVEYFPSAAEVLVEKKWTRLVLDWPK